MTHAPPATPRPKRADAQKNFERLLAVARTVIAEQGVTASLRDVARRAGVGLGTLYRHFPTREALLEVILRTGFDELTASARALERSAAPGDALASWLRDFVAHASAYRGLSTSMIAVLKDKHSALHDSCVAMRSAGAHLLARAQQAGVVRPDLDGTDVFALVAALSWIGDQPALEQRAAHLFDVVLSAVFVDQPRARKIGRIVWRPGALK